MNAYFCQHSGFLLLQKAASQGPGVSFSYKGSCPKSEANTASITQRTTRLHGLQQQQQQQQQKLHRYLPTYV
jgi:hypothetical protein